MHYRSREKLAIIELQENEKIISFSRVKEILFDRPSSIIYCEKNERLYGIISMIDICRADDIGKDYVGINSRFSYVRANEYMKAKKIFAERKNIHALPILLEKDKLAGAWLRWDSIYIDQYRFIRNEKSIWFRKDSKLGLVQPGDECGSKGEIFEIYYSKLRSHGVDVKGIKRDEVLKYADSLEWILMIDEEEREAISALYCRILDRKDIERKIQSISNLSKIVNQELVEGYLANLNEKGASVINLSFIEKGYSKKLRKKISEKFAAYGVNVSNKMTPAMYADFFDELGDKEYAASIMQLRFPVVNRSGLAVLRDYHSPLCNVINGERNTLSQPEKYEKTIYFVGPCFIYGRYAEDKNTIESLLQEKINSDGYKIRVVNLGSPAYSPGIELACARIMDLSVKKGDIVIVYLFRNGCKGIGEIDLNHMLEENNVDEKWMIDHPEHCNHKLNALYADAIYDKVHSILKETITGQKVQIEQDKNFIKKIYLDRYFSDFAISDYGRIGSIVMNCNPFTYGHRHLVEKALGAVDFLIIFVVEEDQSIFSFSERFAMVCEGVADLENVMVVPSGPFILSQTTFPEYFEKKNDEDLMENVENDITLFAEKIAPQLGIGYRFVGEEPEDSVTNEYNRAMKRIFPRNGIQLIEVPRKKQGSNYISASRVRECLAHNNKFELSQLVPESTMHVLFDMSIDENDL